MGYLLFLIFVLTWLNVRKIRSVYESWAYVCKSFLRLSFTLAMSLFLYKKFKGNSIF